MVARARSASLRKEPAWGVYAPEGSPAKIRKRMTIERLYKYRPLNCHTKAIFSEGELRFSTPVQLNDPFDCEPIFATEVDEEGFRTYVRTNLQLLKPNIDSSTLDAKVEKFVRGEYPPTPERLQRFKQDYVHRVRKLGIFSTSKRWESILMWSHYADRHRGICLELNPEVLPSHISVHRVHYLDERPVVNLFTDSQSANVRTACTKSRHWHYEHEWRLVLESNENTPEFPCNVDLPSGFITGVIFGACMPELDREKTLGWTELLSPVPQRYQAELDDRRYRITKYPLPQV